MEKNDNQDIATTNEIDKSICRHCKQPIALDANICHLCKKYQKSKDTFISQLANVPNILSIGILVLSLMQFNEARKKTAEANDALTKATAALEHANKLENDLLTTKHDVINAKNAIDNTSTLLKDISKSSLENYIFIVNNTIWLESFNLNKYKDNIRKFSKLIEPDDDKRIKWLKTLNKPK